MTTHRLKCWPYYFSQILAGFKTSEIRKDDRNFAAGDILELREWDPITETYTGRSIRRRVPLITDLGPVGVKGYVLMEIRPEVEEVSANGATKEEVASRLSEVEKARVCGFVYGYILNGSDTDCVKSLPKRLRAFALQHFTIGCGSCGCAPFSEAGA
jgi:hypothetical protein